MVCVGCFRYSSFLSGKYTYGDYKSGFDKVEFNLDLSYYTGKKFTVIAHNNSINNVYIQKALLNGQEYNKCYLDFADIAAGGTLELFMGDKPNVEWGI